MNAAYNLEKRDQKTLTEDEFQAVVNREVKTRRESVEAFRNGGREDLATRRRRRSRSSPSSCRNS